MSDKIEINKDERKFTFGSWTFEKKETFLEITEAYEENVHQYYKIKFDSLVGFKKENKSEPKFYLLTPMILITTFLILGLIIQVGGNGFAIIDGEGTPTYVNILGVNIALVVILVLLITASILISKVDIENIRLLYNGGGFNLPSFEYSENKFNELCHFLNLNTHQENK